MERNPLGLKLARHYGIWTLYPPRATPADMASGAIPYISYGHGEPRRGDYWYATLMLIREALDQYLSHVPEGSAVYGAAHALRNDCDDILDDAWFYARRRRLLLAWAIAHMEWTR